MTSHAPRSSSSSISILVQPILVTCKPVRFIPEASAFVASSDSIDNMATLTIRQLDEKTKTRLRVRAAHHGRSMEEEAREILRSALSSIPPARGNLAEAIRRRFAAFGGLELKLPRRDAMRQAPGFAE